MNIKGASIPGVNILTQISTLKTSESKGSPYWHDFSAQANVVDELQVVLHRINQFGS